MAMDYLAVQVTSVPCERVFSSAKETDTAKRNRISPLLMEALQMSKFWLKKQRLNFMDGWATSEADMSPRSKPMLSDLGCLFADGVMDDPDGVMDKLLIGIMDYDPVEPSVPTIPSEL
jgi:hypothetical protein